MTLTNRWTDFAYGIGPRVLVLAGTAASTIALTPAAAQDTPRVSTQASASTDSGPTEALQEIVVTAQKRSQNVQDTPLSVTAVSGASLATKSIVTVEDLKLIDPALQISHAAGIVTTFIRGIGNPVTTIGNEASVPVYIDDVYYVRAAYPFLSLGSVDRVEVLKGPQGTLFGRNASGGVISIYTRDPSFNTPEMSGKVGYGNYDTVSGQIYVNRPITDTLAFNFALDASDQSKGWGRNINTGEPTYREHHVSMRGKILWEPTPSTKIKLIGYYERARNEQGIYSRPFPGTVGGYPDGLHNNGIPPVPGAPTGVIQPTNLGFYDTNLNFAQFDRSRGWGASARIDQELGFADFVSISGIRRAKSLELSEGDFSPAEFLRYALYSIDHQFSQEFQLKSKSSSKINWIIGSYYLNALQAFDPTNILGPGPQQIGISSIAIIGKERIKSYAGFGQVTVPITGNTNLTGGLRYTKDKVAGFGTTTATFLPGVLAPVAEGPIPVETQRFDCVTNPSICHKTYNKLTWKASIDHHFGDDVMAYANYSRGYKAGTYNTLPLDSAPLNPEIVDAYEAGVKTELFDRKVRVNAAVFWNDIKNPQVFSQRNGLVALVNAGSARTRGFEVNANAVVAHGLTVNISGSYLDAKFRDFKGAPSYCPSPGVPVAQCQAILEQSIPASNPQKAALVASVGDGNLNQIFIDGSGHRMPYASKIKLTAGLNYTTDAAGFGKIALDGSLNYQSVFNWESDNVIKEPAHTFLDASIQLSPDALDNIGFRFWMKNITGVHYNVGFYGQPTGAAYSSSPGAPRTFGGEVLFKF